MGVVEFGGLRGIRIRIRVVLGRGVGGRGGLDEWLGLGLYIRILMRGGDGGGGNGGVVGRVLVVFWGVFSVGLVGGVCLFG